MKIRIARNVYDQLRAALHYFGISTQVEEIDLEKNVVFYVVDSMERTHCGDSYELSKHISDVKAHLMALEKTLEIMDALERYYICEDYFVLSEKDIPCDAEEIGKKIMMFLEESRYESLLDLLKTWQPEAETIDELNDDMVRLINRQLALFHKGLITHPEMMEAITEIF